MIARLALVALLALGSCQAEEPAPEEPGPVDLSGFDPQAAALQEAACIERGGRWAKGGLSGAFYCFESTDDAGKQCSRESQCDGVCLARSGTCAPFKPFFGCQEVFTDTGLRATLCVD